MINGMKNKRITSSIDITCRYTAIGMPSHIRTISAGEYDDLCRLARAPTVEQHPW